MRDKLLETKDKNIISQIEDFEKVYLQLKDTAVPQLPLEIMVISMTKPQIPSSIPTPVSLRRGDVERVLDKWPEILRVVRPFNHSIEGLLRSTKPVSFDGTKLTLEAFYVFHKDKLSEEKVENC